MAAYSEAFDPEPAHLVRSFTEGGDYETRFAAFQQLEAMGTDRPG